MTHRHVHDGPLGRRALEGSGQPQPRLASRVEQLAVHEDLAGDGAIGHGALSGEIGREALGERRRGGGQPVA